MNIRVAGSAMMSAGILLTGSALGQDIPRLRAVKTEVAPIIDGRLDDACWERAAVAKDFFNFHSRDKAEYQTTIRLLYDDRHLYFGYKCTEPELDKIKVEVAERDGSVYNDDNVEIFLDPINTAESRTGRKFFHLIINANGIVDDRAPGYVEKGSKKLWSPKYPLATARGDGIWSLELALPLQALHQEAQMGRVWRLNFSRTRRLNGRVKPSEASCWAPVFGGFHDSTKWGYLEGLVIEQAASAGTSIRLKGAVLPPARAGSNVMELTLENISGEAKEIKATVKSASPSGKTTESQGAVKLAGKPVETVMLNYNLALEPGEHRILVSLMNSKKALQLPPATVTVGEILDAYLDRNYYTDEKEAEVVVAVANLEEEQLSDLTARVRLSGPGGKTHSEENRKIASATETVKLDIAALAPGEYPVSVELLSGKKSVAKSALVLIRRQPAPDGVTEVKIDKVNQIILVDDKGVFPIGLDPNPFALPLKEMGFNWASSKYLLSHGSGQKLTEMLTDDMAELLVNEFVENAMVYLDRCRAEGVLGGIPFMRLAGRYGGRLSIAQKFKLWEHNIPKVIPPVVKAIRNHPALFCYFPFDEPNDNTADASMLLYNSIRENDPYHPVILLVPTVGEKTMQACDMPGTDNYWSPTVGTPLQLVRGLDREKVKTDKRHLPKLQVPQTGHIAATKREMTPMEQRCQMYLCLTHDVKGILWFGGRMYNPELADECAKINHEMQALAPVLLTKAPAQEVVFDKDECPIHLLVKEYENHTYLLAVNSLDKPLEVTFALNSPDLRKIKVMFEKRTVRPKDNGFTDEFQPHDRHVYKMRSVKKPPGPYRVTLNVKEVPADFYMPGYESEKYFTLDSKAIYNQQLKLIYLRGRKNTLESMAGDLGEEAPFTYDPATRTATVGVDLYIAYKGALTIGREFDSGFKETLQVDEAKRIAEIKCFGRLDVHNSLLKGFSATARFPFSSIVLRGAELDRCRWFSGGHGARVRIENCRIHNCDVGVGNVSDPVVGCEIYDNASLCWSDTTFVDCNLHGNCLRARDNQAGANMVFINTKDDYTDKYEFYDKPHPHMIKYSIHAGSMTVMWHLRVEVADKGGKPIRGVRIMLDAEGDEHDREVVTNERGMAQTDVTQFFRNKDGRENFSYGVSIDTGKGYVPLRKGWTPDKSTAFKYVQGDDELAEVEY